MLDAPPYLPRSIEPALERDAGEFPAVVLTGPRQSGRTTRLRHLFGDRAAYASLEAPDVRAAALEDPQSVLELHPPPVILDEIQLAPRLVSYVEERIDRHRALAGQYLLTGSRNLPVAAGVSESLAGRAAILRLLPMSRREAEGRPRAPLAWEPDAGASSPEGGSAYGDLWADFIRGGYPELVANPGRDARLWHASYVQTYLERDVRTIRQIGDLSQFHLFLRALAARAAGLLDLSEISRDLGVALNTAKAWLSVLEATYRVIVLRPYHANVGKRLVKTPKVYFSDVGTLCYLTGLSDPEHAASGPLAGAIMASAVLIEVVRTLTHRGEEPRLYFWRTSSGDEVDVVVERAGALIPIEVKLSATPRPAFARPIRRFTEDYGARAAPGFVVHPGDVRLPLGAGTTALPFRAL